MNKPAKRRSKREVEASQQSEYGELQARAKFTVRMGKREVFAKNLRILTSLKGLKATTASKAIQAMLDEHTNEQLRNATGRTRQAVTEACADIMENRVDPKWYRRLMQRGVTRANKTSWQHMSAIALFFGLAYEDLWDESLPGHLNLQTQTDHNSTNQFAICTQQLVELLGRGEGRYDYLKSLIESLHAEWQVTRSSQRRRRP